MDKDELANMTKLDLQSYVVDHLGEAITKPNAPSDHLHSEVIYLLHQLSPQLLASGRLQLPYDEAVQIIDGDE